MTREQELVNILIDAIEGSGFSISGPTNWLAAEHGEPQWVCNARKVIASGKDNVGHGVVNCKDPANKHAHTKQECPNP
jgi:hypothetical protein